MELQREVATNKISIIHAWRLKEHCLVYMTIKLYPMKLIFKNLELHCTRWLVEEIQISPKSSLMRSWLMCLKHSYGGVGFT